VLKDPSTVPVTLAAAERIGVELGADLRTMNSDPRAGDLLPAHLETQQRLIGEEV